MKEPRYAMTMDTSRCVGCHACVFACQGENALPEHGFRDWIEVETHGKFPHLTQQIRSHRCNHCETAPCVTACPTGASHVSEGGTVLVTRHKCTGCKACMAACPYDARYVHPEGYVDKCTFCLHRVKRNQQPACVEVCPTQALTFGNLSDPNSEVAQKVSSRRHMVQRPSLGLEPQLYFLLPTAPLAQAGD
jgi:Fe-S-cluster-containing dehydrogenase component